jgi:hypothetical protein
MLTGGHPMITARHGPLLKFPVLLRDFTKDLTFFFSSYPQPTNEDS